MVDVTQNIALCHYRRTDVLHRSSTNYVIIYGNLNIAFQKVTRHWSFHTLTDTLFYTHITQYTSTSTLNQCQATKFIYLYRLTEKTKFNALNLLLNMLSTFSAKTVLQSILDERHFLFDLFRVLAHKLWHKTQMKRVSTLNYASNEIISI